MDKILTVTENKLQTAFPEVVGLMLSIHNINLEKSESLFPESPFGCWYSKEKNLVIHCINTNYKDWQTLSPSLFADMCDEASKRKVKLIHLWYDVWANNNELVQKRLLAQAGISKKIFARNTEVVELTKKESTIFFETNHLQKSANANFHYGLMHRNEIVAAISFSKARKMTYEKELFQSYELIRFASMAGYTITGGLSKLVQHFIRTQNAKHIMTYADRDWSDGISYRKLGFRFIENLEPQSFIIDRIGLKRMFIDEIKLSTINGYSKNLPPWKRENTLIKVYNSGSAKYILDLR